MRKCSLAIIFILTFVHLAISQQGDQSGWYYLNGVGYYKRMLADIRANQLHMRFYRDDAVKFSNSTRSGKHTFWDVGFGGEFPFLGYSYDTKKPDYSIESTGFELFVEGSAHMLLDFNTISSDVLNTDFRFGGGVSSRLPFRGFWKNLTVRIKYFHESTHIGDEFTLGAVADSSFRRYNVSYQAAEFFMAFNRFFPKSTRLWQLSNFRFYGGYRYLGDGIFLSKEPLFDDFRKPGRKDALKLGSRHEIQLGAEVFVKAWLLPSHGNRESESAFLKVIKPQYFVLAADFYNRSRYALVNPDKEWSRNIVVGLIYGDYFRGKRTVRWLFSFYHGINPHGQFRSTGSNYKFGLDYSVSF